MKILLDKHETIFDCWFKPQSHNHKHGEIIPHQNTVSQMWFYYPQLNNANEVYFTKIQLTREMVIDLADKIKEIESEIVDMPFNELPF